MYKLLCESEIQGKLTHYIDKIPSNEIDLKAQAYITFNEAFLCSCEIDLLVGNKSYEIYNAGNLEAFVKNIVKEQGFDSNTEVTFRFKPNSANSDIELSDSISTESTNQVEKKNLKNSDIHVLKKETILNHIVESENSKENHTKISVEENHKPMLMSSWDFENNSKMTSNVKRSNEYTFQEKSTEKNIISKTHKLTESLDCYTSLSIHIEENNKHMLMKSSSHEAENKIPTKIDENDEVLKQKKSQDKDAFINNLLKPDKNVNKNDIKCIKDEQQIETAINDKKSIIYNGNNPYILYSIYNDHLNKLNSKKDTGVVCKEPSTSPKVQSDKDLKKSLEKPSKKSSTNQDLYDTNLGIFFEEKKLLIDKISIPDTSRNQDELYDINDISQELDENIETAVIMAPENDDHEHCYNNILDKYIQIHDETKDSIDPNAVFTPIETMTPVNKESSLENTIENKQNGYNLFVINKPKFDEKENSRTENSNNNPKKKQPKTSELEKELENYKKFVENLQLEAQRMMILIKSKQSNDNEVFKQLEEKDYKIEQLQNLLKEKDTFLEALKDQYWTEFNNFKQESSKLLAENIELTRDFDSKNNQLKIIQNDQETKNSTVYKLQDELKTNKKCLKETKLKNHGLQDKLFQIVTEQEILLNNHKKINDFMSKNFNLLEQDQKRITSAANRIKIWIEHNYDNEVQFDQHLRKEWKDKLELKEAFEKQIKLLSNENNQDMEAELKAIIFEAQDLEKGINSLVLDQKNKIVADLTKVYESLKISFFTHQYLIKFLPKFLILAKNGIESNKTSAKNFNSPMNSTPNDLCSYNLQHKTNSNRIAKDEKVKRMNLKTQLTP